MGSFIRSVRSTVLQQSVPCVPPTTAIFPADSTQIPLLPRFIVIQPERNIQGKEARNAGTGLKRDRACRPFTVVSSPLTCSFEAILCGPFLGGGGVAWCRLRMGWKPIPDLPFLSGRTLSKFYLFEQPFPVP